MDYQGTTIYRELLEGEHPSWFRTHRTHQAE